MSTKQEMMDNCKTKSSRPPKLLKSNAYQPVSNTLAGQTLIYMQMSNHYRRVENAKSIVDSGLHNNGQRARLCNYYDTGTTKNYNSPNPCEYNSTRLSNLYSASSTRTNLNDSGMYSPSPSDMDLVDQIVYDNKHKPNSFYKDSNGLVYAPSSHTRCVQARDTKNKKSPVKPRPKSRSRSPTKSLKTKFQKPSVPMDIIDHHPKQFVPCKNFQPRILKSTAQSRVHDLTVYHAPRKRPLPQHESNPEENIWLTDSQIKLLDQVNNAEAHNVHYKDPWNFEETEMKHHKVDKRPGSKGSSRSNGCDSAYCGEVSSGGGSRGSTPERYSSTKKTPPLKLDRTFNEETYSSADSQDFPMSVETARHRDPVFVDNGYPGNGNKEAAYATFLRKITEDILERGIFTDKGINSIFQRHIEENKYDLNQDRMRLEVSNLRKQLGIADDAAHAYFRDERSLSPNRGTNLHPTVNDSHCRDNCTSQYINNMQPNKNTKNPAIEDIISEMEQCVKIDVRAVQSTCSCPGDGKNIELGCGCDRTCNEANAFEQFFETGFGNRTNAKEQGNKKNCRAVQPDKSDYYNGQSDGRSFDDEDQNGQGFQDRHYDDRVSNSDANEDTRTKSSKSYSRGSKGSRMNSEGTSKSKPSSSDDNDDYYGYRDIETNDSCGTAHVESLCSHIKTESTDDFLLEKLVMTDLMDSGSHFDHNITESEIMKITNTYSDGIQNGNFADQNDEFPGERSDFSSVRDTTSSNGNETDSETEVDIEEQPHGTTSEGRTVYFNKAPERESSLETLQDSKGNKLDRVVKGTGPISTDNLVDIPIASSKALVTFASDKSTPSDFSGTPVDPENLKNIGSDSRSNLDRLRSEQSSTEKKGCFGPCGKKKKGPTAPPPLKSALKARE